MLKHTMDYGWLFLPEYVSVAVEGGDVLHPSSRPHGTEV